MVRGKKQDIAPTRRLPRRLRRKSFQHSQKAGRTQRFAAISDKKVKGNLFDMLIAASEKFDSDDDFVREGQLQAMIDRLQLLPADASWQEIRQTVNTAATGTLPQEVVERAIAVFHGEQKALDWLAENNLVLDGLSPKEYIEQQDGVDEVLNVLGRIAYYDSKRPPIIM